MQWLLYLFGSGAMFFVGVGLIAAGLAASAGRSAVFRGMSFIAVVVGSTVAVSSATPLPLAYYAVAILLTLGWLALLGIDNRTPKRARNCARVLVGTIWLAGAIAELPHHLLPTVPKVEGRRLYLFGDSLAAGLSGDRTQNWPELLSKAHRLELADYAQPGATVSTSLELARAARLDDGVVLLEIGGNDVLGKTDAEAFRDGLEQLLLHVCHPGRQVVMFELPLPPFKNAFGRAQRELANRFPVVLIPKRVLMSLLTGNSIHLSPKGHKRMAMLAWGIVGSAYGD